MSTTPQTPTALDEAAGSAEQIERDVAVDLVFDRVLTRFRPTTNRAPMDAVAARMRGGSAAGGAAGIGRDGRIQKGAFA